MKRGVLYIVWGNYNRKELQRSIDSVVEQGYEYHVAEIEDEGIGLAHKAKMYNLSPFDTTLFLDTDTVVMGNLDYGFEMAEQFNIACCIAPASSAYLAGKEIGITCEIHPDKPQYNTGVIFFVKSELVRFCFKWWKGQSIDFPLSANNDQPTFSISVANPYILPRNWNWRKKIRYESKILHGPVKIIHAR